MPPPLRTRASALLTLLLLGSGCLVNGQALGKEATARTVFERLVMARGDARTPDPTFVFSPLKRHGASASDGTITLEETAYDICMAFGEDGENALAGILAHELIHYYEGHEWEDGFITLVDGSGDAAATVAENSAAFTKDEIEADYFGGFLAHLAGYRTTKLMPNVLANIYAAYDLPDELADYPPLKERQSIAEKTADKLDELVDAYEVSNLLAALGRYEEALEYYNFLLKDFQSREIYNNRGVLYAMAALDHFDPANLPTDYAFQLDFESRMQTGTRGLTRDRELREALLREAIESFTRAVSLDADYPAARLNLASAHSLLAASLRQLPTSGDGTEDAEDQLLAAKLALRKAAKTPAALGNEVLLERISSLKKVVNAQLTEPATARSPVTTGDGPAAGTGATFTIRESIDGSTVDDLLLQAIDWGRTTAISDLHQSIRLKTAYTEGKGGGAGITKLLHQSGREGILFLRAADESAGATSLDIAVGSDRAAIEMEYDEPSRRVELADGGELLVYEASELIFVLRDGLVTRWYLYREV